ncbi:MAG TPA: adenylate/guanylate cyclase domain-containing protein [Chitinophagaceae bacterium]|nr:adenylate/guanylate cyclase domain-containing protein [Chitinophagaceae bacterium]
MSQSRQLAAIMFADIAGYTALMQQDEHKALELINRFKEVLEKVTPEHQGKIIQYFGDGCLLAFDSSVNSVECAMALQKAFSESPQIPVRMGLHLGDVVFRNENVFGDGVNIASRIESLSVPGAILMSKSIRDQIKNKSDFQLTSLGSFDFKNVEEGIEVFALANDSFPVPKRSMMEGKLKKKNLKKRNFIAAISLIILVAAAFFIYINLFVKNDKAADKSIAVLPFVDMSAAKDQEYFSDGLSEELLNLLAKIPELKVIGRTSSFSFKGKNEDLRSIAQKLGVAHILEGSVRKDGKMIRVTAQLIRATDGTHLWSETYDRNLEGLFKLQDEIAGAVVKQLKLKLLTLPSSVTKSSNIEVHNLILQGNYFNDKLDKVNMDKALDLYYQALAIDSLDAKVWVAIARNYSRQVWQNYIPQNEGSEKTLKAIEKAIALDDNLAQAHRAMAGYKLYHSFDLQGAEADFQKALILEPGNPDIFIGLGDVRRTVGRWKEAEQLYNKSILLNPLKPLYYMDLGNCQSYLGRSDDAIKSFKKVLEIDSGFQRAHLYQGINYLLLGKPDLALTEMEKENLEIFKMFGLALAYHALHRKKEADEMLIEFTDKYQNDWSYLLAQLHAYRGEKDAAFTWLETAYNKKDGWLFWVKGDPLLKNLKTDPRYNAFLKKMKLPID